MPEQAPHTLDPDDWQDLRSQGHRMLDDMLDFAQHIRSRPVWQPIPDGKRAEFRAPLPAAPSALAEVHASFMRDVLPYAACNAHPGFMGWVQGGGTAVGMLADMLAAGLNANLGGRDQMPLEVERQVLAWVRELFRFPATASGLFVTGTSMANLIGVLVARTAALGNRVRKDGVGSGARLTGYASCEAHESIAQAMDLAGIGSDALRLVPVNDAWQIDVAALEQMIAEDLARGCTPFFIAGTAGSVNVGAIDDLEALAEIAQAQDLWLHVDGAYGALAMLAPDCAHLLKGIDRADSLAFDFHKWAQVPYDAGFVLVKDGALHLDTFAGDAAYLGREQRGLSAGSPWPCDFGPDLSRGFRALKTWFTLKVYGTDQLGKMISGTCALARNMARRIVAEPELELMAPVALNIVCFRYRAEQADAVNREIVINIQESGVAAPSTTRIGGRLAIRAALFNHRSTAADTENVVQACLEHGRRIAATTSASGTVTMTAAPAAASKLAAPHTLTAAPAPTLTAIALAASANERQYQPLMGLAVLMRKVFAGEDVAPLSQELIARANADADDANALIDLSTLLHLGFTHGLARALQAQALAITRLYTLQAAREPAIRLLALMSPGDLMTNAPLEFLLEGSSVTLHMLYLEAGAPLPREFPQHDLIFNAIGESAHTREMLQHLQGELDARGVNVLNQPRHVLKTSRDSASRLIRGLPGIAMPQTACISRATLEAVGRGESNLDRCLQGAAFPVIVRPLDSHAGRGLARLTSVEQVAAYLAPMPDDDFYISRFVDYRGADGLFRKFRVVMIDGVAYAGHMAISRHWMIHYLNADMLENSANRNEEARFMAEFEEGFAHRHRQALATINRAIGLDYLVIDCAETPDGDLLVFEVDSGAVVHAMDPVEAFPYKLPQMQKVFAAFRAMLGRRVARTSQAAVTPRLSRTGT